jgi:hypothetical protein
MLSPRTALRVGLAPLTLVSLGRWASIAAAELAFDIDYVLKWVQPGPGESYFTFWIAPATLVFENVSDLQIDLQSFGGITILDLQREDKQPTRSGFVGPDADWRWTLDCLEGVIQLRATGFRQTIRRVPVYKGAQRISFVERGGISFNEQSPEPLPLPQNVSAG